MLITSNLREQKSSPLSPYCALAKTLPQKVATGILVQLRGIFWRPFVV
jgi:hypothetical protein